MPGVTGLDLHQRLSASGKPIPPRSLSAGRAEGCRSATASRIAQARERQVMALLVAGRVNKQIAAEIGISEVTVRLHRPDHTEDAGRFVADLVRAADKVKI